MYVAHTSASLYINLGITAVDFSGLFNTPTEVLDLPNCGLSLSERLPKFPKQTAHRCLGPV